jgi:hypothetical protein
VELNHRHADFQSGGGGSRRLLINHLQRLPPFTPGTPWHNYGNIKSEIGTFLCTATAGSTGHSDGVAEFGVTKGSLESRFHPQPSTRGDRRPRALR